MKARETVTKAADLFVELIELLSDDSFDASELDHYHWLGLDILHENLGKVLGNIKSRAKPAADFTQASPVGFTKVKPDPNR